jgi:predicted lipoprotein with Yx(FWY)xxD motif
MNRVKWARTGGVALLLACAAGLPGVAVGSAKRTFLKVQRLQDGLNTPTLANVWGLSLYMSTGDKNGRSSCYGQCTRVWKPLRAIGILTATKGINPKLLGKTRRSDGTLQVTYNRHPLYLFVQPPPETRGAFDGEGCNSSGGGDPNHADSHWWLLTPQGKVNKNESSLCEQAY